MYQSEKWYSAVFDRAEHVSHANSYWTDSVYRNDTARQVTSLGSGYLHAGRWVIENITYQAKIIESSVIGSTNFLFMGCSELSRLKRLNNCGKVNLDGLTL